MIKDVDDKWKNFTIGRDLLDVEDIYEEIRIIDKKISLILKKTDSILVKDLLKDMYESFDAFSSIRRRKKIRRMEE